MKRIVGYYCEMKMKKIIIFHHANPYINLNFFKIIAIIKKFMSNVQYLNPKAEVLKKIQALAMNINAAMGLQDVMKSNLGPKGTLKMYHPFYPSGWLVEQVKSNSPKMEASFFMKCKSNIPLQA